MDYAAKDFMTGLMSGNQGFRQADQAINSARALRAQREKEEAANAKAESDKAFNTSLSETLASGGDLNELLKANPKRFEQIKQIQDYQTQLGKSGAKDAAGQLAMAIDRGDNEGALSILESNRNTIDQIGDASFTTDNAIAMLKQNPDQLKKLALDTYVMSGGKRDDLTGEGGKTAAQSDWESMTEGFNTEEKEKAARIKAGLLPRATGSAAQTISELGNVEKVAETESQISAGKEAGKLSAQLEIQPKIKTAVETAAKAAASIADSAAEKNSNEVAYEVYETAMNGLSEALGVTDTGPFIGKIMPLTANQQISDGAIAAMAPVLKQMFRASGEGTFTDQDQKLLLDMVPTRTDLPEARAAKMKNIDAIIRAKLQIGGDESTNTVDWSDL